MDRLIYVAMSGARQTMRAQMVTTSNLANAETPGFRADLATMRAMPVVGPGAATRVYAMATGTGTDFEPGAMAATGRELDVAVDGRGYIAVQGPDGREAYTRAGNLEISAAGQLTTGEGWPVLGNAGPIAVPPAEKVEIGADGTVSVRPLGEEATTMAAVDRIKLVDPDQAGLEKSRTGLLQLRDGMPPAAADAGVGLASGQLEGSNVNAIAEMVSMIDYARQFEMQMRVMTTARADAEKASELLRLG